MISSKDIGRLSFSPLSGKGNTRFLVVLIVILTCVGNVKMFAQEATPVDETAETVWHIEAGFGESESTGDVTIFRFTQSVYAESDKSRLWSDEAVQYPDRYVFMGGVTIVDQADTLTAAEVVYYRDDNRGFASGDVRLSDGDAVLTAPSALYDSDKKQAEFDRGVRLVDSVSVLSSRGGLYWTQEKRARFYGDVHLTQADMELFSDSLEHFREDAISEASGHVRLVQQSDTTDVTESVTYLAGDHVSHEQNRGRTRISGSPAMVRIARDSVESDTLAILSEFLVVSKADGVESLQAWGDVRIWQKDLASVADSVSFWSSDRTSDTLSIGSETIDTTGTSWNTIRLFGDPLAWVDETQLSGDSLLVAGTNGNVDSLLVTGSAFLAQPDSASGRFQQVQGQTLDGKFEQDTLRVIRAGPNAEAIYFRTDGESGELEDAVQMSADEIWLTFEAGTVRSVRALSGIEGKHYEPDAIPEPLQLAGFRWEAERRPTRDLLHEAIERMDGMLELVPDNAAGEMPILPTEQRR